MQLQLMQNENFKIRTIEKDGAPWFVGKDVAAALGYANQRQAVRVNVKPNHRFEAKFSTEHGERTAVLIDEAGLYLLVMRANTEQAENFQEWVTCEVLPSLRKHGAYMTSEVLSSVQGNSEEMAELVAKLESERASHLATMRTLGEREREIQAHQENIAEKEKQLAAFQGELAAKDVLIEKKNAYFQRVKPKIDFAKAVYDAKTAILVGEMAKLLAENGIDIGQNRFFAWLRANGYLMVKEGQMYNLPYQKCIERGIMVIKESVGTDARGVERITRTPMVTGKGQRYFLSKFLATRDEEALAAIDEEELRAAAEAQAYANSEFGIRNSELDEAGREGRTLCSARSTGEGEELPFGEEELLDEEEDPGEENLFELEDIDNENGEDHNEDRTDTLADLEDLESAEKEEIATTPQSAALTAPLARGAYNEEIGGYDEKINTSGSTRTEKYAGFVIAN